MANLDINYTERINRIMDELPEFVSDFIYNYGQSDKVATKFQYCRDIRDFFQYIVNYKPEFCDKKINELTINDISEVDALDVNRYLAVLKGNGKNGLKNTTLKRRRATLSSMYSFYVNSGKLKANPVLATKPVDIPKKELIYLTNDEQRLLLDTVRTGVNLTNKEASYHELYVDRDSALFLLLLDTGLRVSEMLTTDIIDYDLEKCSVIVQRKGGDIQQLFYSDECSQYLSIYFTKQRAKYRLDDKDMPAFTTINGDRLGVRAVENLVKKYVKACLPEKTKILSPHKLRSSFAMSFYRATNNDILLLKKKLNHKSISTTSIYADADNTEMEKSRSVLQGLR